MKKRTIALMLSVLAVMMLVGVGFATWVISQGTYAEATGNIVVDVVHDERLDVEGDGLTHELVFGAPASATTGWLTSDNKINGGDVKVAKMEDTFTFKIKKASGVFTDEDDVNAQVSFTLGQNSTNPALISNGAIEVTSKSLNLAKDELTVVVKVSYNWGTLFGNKNPYEFFNATGIKANTPLGELAATANTAGLKKGEANFAATDTYADLALSALTALQSFGGNEVFAIKVEFKVAGEA